jgi:hypothetical protein
MKEREAAERDTPYTYGDLVALFEALGVWWR